MSILLKIRSSKYVNTHQICVMSLIGFFAPLYRYILIFGDKLYSFDFQLLLFDFNLFIDIYHKH